jgi:hypothetical protein
MTSPFDSVWDQLQQQVITNPNDREVVSCERIFSAVKTFSMEDSALFSGATEGFNDLNKKVEINSDSVKTFFTEGASAGGDFQASVAKLMADAGVNMAALPKNTQKSLTRSIAAILNGGVDASRHFQMTSRGDKSVAAMHEVTSRGAYSQVMNDVNTATAFEAFGVNIDHVVTDARLNIALTIVRSWKSLMDRVFSRISHKDPIIKIRIPEVEVYNLGKSQSADAKTRYSMDHRRTLIDLYRNPEIVDTTAKPVTLKKSNDTGTETYLVADDVLMPGVRANMLDLHFDSNRSGFDTADYTDLVSEGAEVKSVLVQLTLAGTPNTVETFSIPTLHYAGGRFTEHDNQQDSSVRVAMLRDVMFNLTSTTLQSNGSASVILADVDTSDAIRLSVSFSGDVELKTSYVSGNPTAKGEAIVIGDADADPATATQDIMDDLTVEAIGWSIDATWSEENVRKADLAIRHNVRPQAYEIPVGRTMIADFSLQQVTTEEVLESMGTVADIGNSTRGLSVIRGHLDTVNARNTFEKENAAQTNYFQTVGRQYAAGTVVKPYVVKTTIDISASGIAIMRESERPSDLHALMRFRFLAMDSLIKTNSQYMTVFKPGETPVIKVIAARPLVDILFGIDAYHNVLSDLPEGGRKMAGSDYSFNLQNDTRVDVYGTSFKNMDNTVIGMYVRDEGSEDEVTSFAAIRDCGNFMGSYTLTNGNAANKRFIHNTREIPFVTNPIGFECTITGLNDVFSGIDFT